MSQHGFNDFDASERSGVDLPAILGALQTLHFGPNRPSYAEAGMIWAKEVRSSTGDLYAADLYFDTGAQGILIGNFNFVSKRFTLNSAVLANSGIKAAAYRYVGTNTGNLVEVLSNKRLPALDGSDLTGFGTAAKKNVGTNVGQLIEVLAGGKLPPLDGSDLTGLDTGIPPSMRVAKLPEVSGAGAAAQGGGVIMSDGSLRCWGWASNGALGQGAVAMHNRSVPIAPGFPASFDETPIKWVRRGLENFVVTAEGNVWVWGENAYGALGVGNTAVVATPTKIPYFGNEKIIDVAAGSHQGTNSGSALFLAESGKLFACGNNGTGQLGLGDRAQRTTPVQVTKTDWAKIYNFGCRLGVSAGIDRSGRLYLWGFGYRGGQANGGSGDQLTPRHVNNFGGRSIVKVAGASDGTGGSGDSVEAMAALTDDGRVYTWGTNWRGGLGTGNTSDVRTPYYVSTLGTGNVDISMSSYKGVTVVTKSNGQVWVAGYNEYGQLGIGTYSDRSTFALLPNSQRAGCSIVQTLLVGQSQYTSIAILYDDGEIHGVGHNPWGTLGVGNQSNTPYLSPMRMPKKLKPVAMVPVGMANQVGIGVLTEDGSYFQTGYAGSFMFPATESKNLNVPAPVRF